MNEEEKQSKNEKNIENNTNNIRNAADVAIATKNPYGVAVGKGIKLADKVSGGRSTEKLGKAMNTANKFSPAGKRMQNLSNKLNESGASDKIGQAASLKNGFDSSPNNTEKGKELGSNPDDNSDDKKNKDTIRAPKKKKTSKIAIISLISFLFLSAIFIVVLITPLIFLGIIDVDAIDIGSSTGTVTGGSNTNYTIVSDNASYWWPIGGDEGTDNDGTLFAAGPPISTLITSPFGNRDNPTNRGNIQFHTGIDIGGAARGTPIIATQNGIVITEAQGGTGTCVAGQSSGYGNYIKIQHDDGNVTLYGHMDTNSVLVRLNDTVKQGQVIGRVGTTGNSTGYHLHFEVIENGSYVDPRNYVFADNPRPIEKKDNSDDKNDNDSNTNNDVKEEVQ